MPAATYSVGMQRLPKTCLVDGHSLIHRCHHASGGRQLESPTGEPTGTVYKFAQTFFGLIETLAPDYLAFAVDGQRSDLWRRKIYPNYKASRDAKDSAKEESTLKIEIPRIHEIIRASGVQVVYKKGYEADDAIATLAKRFGRFSEVCIVSQDKDLLQCVKKNVRIYDAFGLSDKGVSHVKEKYGLEPKQLVALQTLMGDASDGITGVPGIGEKTALRLLHEYGTIRNILENLQSLPAAQRNRLYKAKREGTLKLMRKLVTLSTDVPIRTNRNVYKFDGFNFDALGKILSDELEFSRWWRWIPIHYRK